jgi:DNA-binding CsgD family transcriptional regulator
MQQLSAPGYFIQNTEKLFRLMAGAAASCFYLVDENDKAFGHSVTNLSRDTIAHYARYDHLDPLHPRNFRQANSNLVLLDEVVPRVHFERTIYYREFMQPNKIHFELEVFFRNAGGIIAGLSLIRTPEQQPFDRRTIEALRPAQRYTEYCINSFFLPQLTLEDAVLRKRFELTPRQVEIVRLIRQGATNERIARILSIELPTVKTHLQNIFHRTGATSRTHLVSQIYLSSNEDRSPSSGERMGVVRDKPNSPSEYSKITEKPPVIHHPAS